MTTLIRNAVIVAPGKKSTERLDVFVSGEKISAIGSFPQRIADEVIDAEGAYLAPGFIDVNTDSDHYLSLFSNPRQDDFLRQGVTTIVGGQCGASLAPLLYGSLESIQKWVDVSKVNVDWHLTGELLKVLDKQKLGVNFATLVGHSTIRRALVGETLRDLSPNEIQIFKTVVRQALREGAFGFSSGLSYIHSFHTPSEELQKLAAVVRDEKGLYATHLRKAKEDIHHSVEETITLARSVKIPTVISHYLPVKGFEKQYQHGLEQISNISHDQPFYFDLYPFDVSVLPLYTFLPAWAQNGGLGAMNINLADEWMSKKILRDLPNFEEDDFTVSRAVNNETLVGSNLGDIARMYGLRSTSEALLKLMQTTKLKASIFYHNVNMEVVKTALAHPRSLIASNAASFHENKLMRKPARASGTFPAFLKLLEKDRLLPLKEGIQKITATPAKLYGFNDRGEVKEGFIADLACFKDGAIKFTMVGGVVAFRDGHFTGRRAGKVLRHTSKQ